MPCPALHWLVGARLQRVDIPQAGLLCLTLYAAGQRHHLVARFDGSTLPGLLPQRPRGEGAGGLAQRLRKRLSNTRLASASWRAAGDARAQALLLRFDGHTPGALCVVLDRRCANLVCLDDAGRAIIVADVARFRSCGGVLGKPWSPPPEALAPPFPDDEASWRAAAAQQPGGNAAAPGPDPVRTRALRSTRRSLRRVERKLAAIESDLARADEAGPLRERAQWLLCHLDRVPPGAAEIELPAPDGSDRWETLQLDPALSALANAERWFARARRFERGRPIASQRAETTRAERDALQRLVERLAEPDADVEALLGPRAGDVTRAEASAPRPGRRQPRVERLPYRSFESEPPFRILVGRGAVDNDALTLHHARPTDLWLHVRESPGAHVVVPLAKGQTCPDRVRLDAALLAAHFSPQARERQADVSWCERRYVRKRKGSPPGTVTVEREKVLGLRLDSARIRWLLERELRP